MQVGHLVTDREEAGLLHRGSELVVDGVDVLDDPLARPEVAEARERDPARRLGCRYAGREHVTRRRADELEVVTDPPDRPEIGDRPMSWDDDQSTEALHRVARTDPSLDRPGTCDRRA